MIFSFWNNSSIRSNVNSIISGFIYILNEFIQTHKEIKSINGHFKIKNFEHGILIQFIEEIFSNQSAKINLILKDTSLSFETNRIEQNILSTNAIQYAHLHDLESVEIEYNTNPKINKPLLDQKEFLIMVIHPRIVSNPSNRTGIICK